MVGVVVACAQDIDHVAPRIGRFQRRGILALKVRRQPGHAIFPAIKARAGSAVERRESVAGRPLRTEVDIGGRVGHQIAHMNSCLGQSVFAAAGDRIALHELTAAGMTRDDDGLERRERDAVRQPYENRVEGGEAADGRGPLGVVAALPAGISPVQRLGRQMIGGGIRIVEELRLDQQHRFGIQIGGGATHFRNRASVARGALDPVNGDDRAGDRRLRPVPIRRQIERQGPRARGRRDGQAMVCDEPHRSVLERSLRRGGAKSEQESDDQRRRATCPIFFRRHGSKCSTIIPDPRSWPFQLQNVS
jgi:hypothetical protein